MRCTSAWNTTVQHPNQYSVGGNSLKRAGCIFRTVGLTSNLPNSSTAALWMTDGNKFLCLKAISHRAVPSPSSAVSCRLSSFQKTIITLKAAPTAAYPLFAAPPVLGGQPWNQTVLRTGRVSVRDETGGRHCQPWVPWPGSGAGQPLLTAGTDTAMGGTISWTQWTWLIFQLPVKKAFKKSAC